MGAEKLEKDNFLAANHPRPSTGFISFNPTASPQDSPSGYDVGHEAMNDSCSWSEVGSHAHVHTNWFCSLDRLLNYFPPPYPQSPCLLSQDPSSSLAEGVKETLREWHATSGTGFPGGLPCCDLL